MSATKRLLESLLNPTVADILKHRKRDLKNNPDYQRSPESQRHNNIQNAKMLQHRIGYRLAQLEQNTEDPKSQKRQRDRLVREIKELLQFVKNL
jgi:hypothetical protein